MVCKHSAQRLNPLESVEGTNLPEARPCDQIRAVASSGSGMLDGARCPSLPQLVFGEELDVDTSDHGSCLETDLTGGDGVIPIGHRHAVCCLVEKLEDRMHDGMEICRVAG